MWTRLEQADLLRSNKCHGNIKCCNRTVGMIATAKYERDILACHV